MKTTHQCPSALCTCAECIRKTSRFLHNNHIVDRPYLITWGECRRMYYKGNTTSTKKQKEPEKFSLMLFHEEQLKFFKNREERLTEITSKIRKLRRETEKLTKEFHYNNLSHKDRDNMFFVYQLSGKSELIEKLEEEYNLTESGYYERDYLIKCSHLVDRYLIIDDIEKSFLSNSEITQEEENELNILKKEKMEIIHEYRLYFGHEETNIVDLSYDWQHCGDCNTRGNIVIEKSCSTCLNCGSTRSAMESDTLETLAYKDRELIDTKPQFTYDKRSHLEDWLRRFQAKENRSIPQEILDKVVLEAKKERIRDLDTLTEDKVKKYLKKLGLNEYYDNVINIINRINGRPPFLLTVEIEEKIKHMFQQIQEPYEKYKPKNRKNFLSYSYTLHKFFQILGLNEFSKYFPLLKSPEKLRQQDDIFKKVVVDMSQRDSSTNWVFYPSI